VLLVEHHRPLRELAVRYAIIDELECEMIERLLGCEVRRSVEEVSGLVRVTFQIKTIAQHE
jgi:predicted ArsR family transcriptional regulator